MAASYQWTTKNESALQLFKMLKDIGIQNNKRHLTLLDTELANIDPLDENLPSEWQDRVINECMNNPWYYYREIIRIPSESGDLINFRFDIASYASIILKFLGFCIYVEKPRQTGKTVEAMVTGGYSFNMLSQNSSSQLFHFDDKKVKLNLAELQKYLSLLPKYLQIYRFNIENKNGLDIVKELPESGSAISKWENKILKNLIQAGTAGNREDVAEKAGRGAKVKEIMGDEVGFWPFADVTLDAALPAYNTASQNARDGGKLAYLHLLSTPPDMKTRAGKYLYKVIKTGALQFEPYMLDLSADEIRRKMKRLNTEWIYITFQYYELGFTEDWIENIRKQVTKEKFRRDYLLHWMVDLENSPFNVRDIETLQDMARVKKYKAYRLLQDFEFKVYEYEGMTPDDVLRYFKNKPILIGCDVAVGLGGDRDSSTAIGSCPLTGKTIFSFKNNTVSTKEFGQILMYLTHTYFNKALIIIERNITGTIDTIRGTKFEKHLYYTPMSKDQLSRGLKGHKDGKFIYGIYQLESIRKILYDDMLVDIVKNHKNIIDVPDLVNEVCGMIYNKYGKIDHSPDTHDDCVMAKMISIYPMLYDPNYSARYGIKKGHLVPDLIEDPFNMSVEDIFNVNVEKKNDNEEGVKTIDDFMDDIKGYGLDNAYNKSEEYESQIDTSDIERIRSKGASYKNLMNNWYDTDLEGYK